MPIGWFVVEPPTQGDLSMSGKKALTTLFAEMPTVGSLNIQLKKAVMAMAGNAPYVGTLGITAKKATVGLIGRQEDIGQLKMVGKKAIVELSQDLVIGGMSMQGAKAIAALTGSQVLVGSMGVVVKKATANLLGIQENSGVMTINAKKAIALADGLQEQVGSFAVMAKKAIAAGVGTGPTPVSYQTAAGGWTGATAFGTTVTATGTFDLSSYSGVNKRCLIVGIASATTGTRTARTTTWNGVALTPIPGATILSGSYQSDLFYVLNPAAISASIVASFTGNNAAREIWAAAMLFGDVGSVAGGAGIATTSTVGQGITGLDNEIIVNTMAAGGLFTGYTQTARVGPVSTSTMGVVLGTAPGDGTSKNFMHSLSGVSAAARLLP